MTRPVRIRLKLAAVCFAYIAVVFVNPPQEAPRTVDLEQVEVAP